MGKTALSLTSEASGPASDGETKAPPEVRGFNIKGPAKSCEVFQRYHEGCHNATVFIDCFGIATVASAVKLLQIMSSIGSFRHTGT